MKKIIKSLIGVGTYVYISPILNANKEACELEIIANQELINEYDETIELTTIENDELHQMLSLGYNNVTDNNIEELEANKNMAKIIDIVANEIYPSIKDNEGGLNSVTCRDCGDGNPLLEYQDRYEDTNYSPDGGFYYATLDEEFNIVYYKIDEEYLEAILNITENPEYLQQVKANSRSLEYVTCYSDNQATCPSPSVQGIAGPAVDTYNEWFNGDYQAYFTEHKLCIRYEYLICTSSIVFDEDIFYKADGSKYETENTGESIMAFEASYETRRYTGTEDEMVSVIAKEGEIKNTVMYIASSWYMGLIDVPCPSYLKNLKKKSRMVRSKKFDFQS
ncbi:MAG: hypothetical protein JJE03_05265 [Peptostreptococcaceae bacterium]|nr:hypothetical protein [Peptostreptococcaceae bacterium]